MSDRYITETDPEDIRPDQLSFELESIDGFSHILTGAGVVEILFYDEVTQDQIDASDAIIAGHVPGAIDVKIARYTTAATFNAFEPPLEVDYVTGLCVGLYRSVESLEGDLPSQVIYYASASSDEDFVVTYSDPVVQEDYVYSYDALDVLRETQMTISWFLENGSLHETTKIITSFV